jgi:autophagy-related protein 13
MLALSVAYLTAPQHFALDELESLLSSRFASLDEGPDFTPTLVKNHARDSLSSSPSSLAIRTSLPASPPLAVRHQRTTSFPVLGSPGARIGLPSSASRPPDPGMGSAISVASSSRPGSTSREDVYSYASGAPLPAATARLRKESTGSIRGPVRPPPPIFIYPHPLITPHAGSALVTRPTPDPPPGAAPTQSL